jgi:hypothetical protein
MPPVKSEEFDWAPVCPPRCQAVVDLISRVQRPYLFYVQVHGQPPYRTVRRYEIQANSDREAAQAGMARFCQEMTHPARYFDKLVLVT